MINEVLLVVSALADIFMVFVIARIDPKRLFGTIALNLILITIFGSKLITVFGFTTNVGNVFYACVFLATHFILERQSKKEALQTIWFGVGAVLFFLILSQSAVHFSGVASGDAVNGAIGTLFMLSPRIALASMLAYMFAQYVNISVYSWLKERMTGKYLWLRSNVANILGQLVDSCLFFTIAFLDLPGTALIQAILVGWVIKTFVVFLGTPFLYLDRYILLKNK